MTQNKQLPIEVDLEGKMYEMPVTYRALKKFALVVVDPIQASIQAMHSGALSLTFEQVIDGIHIGITEGGADLEREEVARILFDRGIMKYYEVVAAYMAALTQGGPTKPQPNNAKKKQTAKKGQR